MATIQFLGAAGSVTGSKYLITTETARVLLDCGLFQGPQALKALNWSGLPIAPGAIDAVVLTHAHLDHAGYLPRLVAQGFKGRATCTTGTAELLGVLLPDAGYLAEEEAAHANRKGWSRHVPAKPLFTLEDAERSLKHLRGVPYDSPKEVAPGVTATFHPAGHILGSAIVELAVTERGHTTRLVFSGDLGRSGMPLLKDPTPMKQADFVFIESTYGDRRHPAEPAEAELARVVNAAARRGGMLVIPAFAVGRAQELLYVLQALESRGLIPVLDIFLDSPMALDATAITLRHAEEFDAEAMQQLREGRPLLAPRKLHLIRDAERSRRLNQLVGPGIIISASGMATGGRVKHHLAHRLGDTRHTVCFVGFQAAGTKGRALVDGARSVWIHGKQVPVCATIERIEGFSAHADQGQLLDWLAAFEAPPRQTFIVHGEPQASEALAAAIQERLGWKTLIPQRDDLVSLPTPHPGPLRQPAR